MIKIDGLYKSTTKIDKEDGEEYWRYLLFRDNGEVIFVSSTGTESDVANWILGQKDQCKGPYVVSGSAIEFWVKTESALLKTRFDGEVKDSTLSLKVWNSNNDFNYEDSYIFKEVAIKPPYKASQPTPKSGAAEL